MLFPSSYNPQAQYYDINSLSECYCNGEFLELETLAPITIFEPNQTVPHVEKWDLFKDIPLPKRKKDVQALVETLGLE